MFTLKINKSCESDFVEFWALQYSYPNENLYNNNIGKDLTEKRVFELFEWKNGIRLSDSKLASVTENYIEETNLVTIKSSEEELKQYLNMPGGAIWRIFWLHCNYPEKYPIYDQHVHRSMAYLKGWDEIEIPYYNPRKVDFYVHNYLDFYAEFSTANHKKLDEALWAFGKFLSYGYKL